MSKTFKSVTDNESELDVRANDCGVFIAFSRVGQIRQASTFAPSDAPALALAILEAAGYKEHSKANLDSSELLASYGLTKLRQAVQAQEREESEARERAELEAEALELLNTRLMAAGKPTLSRETVNPRSLDEWLAVARRARELAKEATK